LDEAPLGRIRQDTAGFAVATRSALARAEDAGPGERALAEWKATGLFAGVVRAPGAEELAQSPACAPFDGPGPALLRGDVAGQSIEWRLEDGGPGGAIRGVQSSGDGARAVLQGVWQANGAFWIDELADGAKVGSYRGECSASEWAGEWLAPGRPRLAFRVAKPSAR
jgi:hypothetical protein